MGVFRLIDFEIPEQEVLQSGIDRSCELSRILRVLVAHTVLAIRFQPASQEFNECYVGSTLGLESSL